MVEQLNYIKWKKLRIEQEFCFMGTAILIAIANPQDALNWMSMHDPPSALTTFTLGN